MEIKNTFAIIPCAGKGSRLNLKTKNKALVKINKQPALNLLIRKLDKYILIPVLIHFWSTV